MIRFLNMLIIQYPIKNKNLIKIINIILKKIICILLPW